MKSKNSTITLLVIILIAILYFCTGFFVIQPVGAVPDGVTIWYFRLGLNIPFIASADGMMVKESQSVNLFGRALISGAVFVKIKDRIILKLPYFHSFYLISTGGKEFEK